jgi:plastocyanin
MKRQIAVSIGLALAASATLALGSSSVDIGINEFKFAPAALEVRPGTTAYEYFCALHPKMRATVIVR